MKSTTEWLLRLFLDLDIYMGTPQELEYRISRLASQPKWLVAREFLGQPKILKYMWNVTVVPVFSSSSRIISKMIPNLPWLGDVSF